MLIYEKKKIDTHPTLIYTLTEIEIERMML